jgi:hypothetical protein
VRTYFPYSIERLLAVNWWEIYVGSARSGYPNGFWFYLFLPFFDLSHFPLQQTVSVLRVCLPLALPRAPFFWTAKEPDYEFRFDNLRLPNGGDGSLLSGPFL